MKRALFSILIALLVGVFTLPVTTLAQIITNHDQIPIVTISKPDVGKTIVEPSFNTSLTRISDARTEGREGVFPRYSKRQVWNVDESLMLLSTSDGSTLLYDGQTYKFKKALIDLKGEDIFWHPTDPFLAIYNSGNSLRSYNVITDEVKLIHSFSEYFSISTRGGGNLSADGRYYAFLGLNTKFPNLGFSNIVVFDIWADQVIAKKLFYSNLAEFNWVSISPKGNYIVVDYEVKLDPEFRGVEVYDRSLNLIWRKPLWSGNGDLGIDANGDEVLVMDRYDSQTNSYFIEKHQLSDEQMTLLLEHSSLFYTNISCRNLPPSAYAGWCLITTYDNESRLTDSVDSWLPFEDEIFLLSMNGSQDVQRLAHHHSRRYSPTTPDNDRSIAFAQPQATISRNGDRMLFASNWLENIELVTSIDTYIIDMRDTTTLKDFRLELSSDAITTKPGDVAAVDVDIKAIGDFRDTVTLDVNITPNPENFRIFFAVSNGRVEKTRVGIMVLKETSLGSYLLHITGRSGNLVHHAGVLVQVGAKQQNFQIRLQPTAFFVKQGEEFNVMAMVERYNGFSEGVAIWVINTKVLKIKATPSIIPDVDTMAIFNLKTSKKTPLGKHQIMFAAKANSGRVQMAAINLTVTE